MTVVDVRELGSLISRRRVAKRLTLRDVEEQLEHALTASTISRLENGATPDIGNVPILARWLGIPLNQIAWPGQAGEQVVEADTPAVVEVHLRADRKLDPDAAEALASMFRMLYDNLASGDAPVTPTHRKKK